MSLFPTQFQIISDLHLETPKSRPTYSHFSKPSAFPLLASNLCLLGDIGLAHQEEQLFSFLTSLLTRTPNLKIFYILGNHEPYESTLEHAISTLARFETESRRTYGERFFLLHRRRVDINNITILGCTLWSNISTQAQRCASALTDFHVAHGIKSQDADFGGLRTRTVEEHNADHAADLAWLNEQVTRIEAEEPEREIVILTHHSPTTDQRATNPAHADSDVKEGFRTDLREEVCWRSKQVKLWAFGHTHYSCGFRDIDGESEGSGKLVVANQKGYARQQERDGGLEDVGYGVRTLVVTAGEPWTFEWGDEVPASQNVTESRQGIRSEKQSEQSSDSKPKVRVRGAIEKLFKLGKGSRDV